MVRTFGKDVATTSEGRYDHEGDTDTFLLVSMRTQVIIGEIFSPGPEKV